jgi:hypothetical protein
MEDIKKVSDYNLDNGGILNIYKWTGSIPLENGLPVAVPECLKGELKIESGEYAE